MTRDERIEAIARAIAPKAWATVGQVGADTLANQNRRTASIRHARAAINAAYPELAAGTHWIAPREMTREMADKGTVAMTLDIARRSGPLLPDTPENAFSRGLIVGGCSRSSIELKAAWSAARDAYLKQEGGE